LGENQEIDNTGYLNTGIYPVGLPADSKRKKDEPNYRSTDKITMAKYTTKTYNISETR